MKNLPLLLFAFCLFTVCNSCIQDLDGGEQVFSFGTYLVDKSTGENLIGDGKPYKPGDLEVFVMYYGDSTTKRDHHESSNISKSLEKGNVLIVDVGNSPVKTEFIIYLGDLKPDTVTLKDGVKKPYENIDLFLNGKKEDNFFLQHYRDIPFIKIEKEL